MSPHEKSIVIPTGAEYNIIINFYEEVVKLEFLALNNGMNASLVGIGTFLMRPKDAEMSEIAKVDRNKRHDTATPEALKGYVNFAPDFDSQS